MVIRLAAVEGDKFSGNSDSGVQHYEANQGPTDLSTANIQYVTDIIRIYIKGFSPFTRSAVFEHCSKRL